MREVGALGSEVRKQVATFSKKDQVIKLSPNLVKLNVVIIFSPNLVDFWSTFLVIFFSEEKSGNILTKFGEHFGEPPNLVKLGPGRPSAGGPRWDRRLKTLTHASLRACGTQLGGSVWKQGKWQSPMNLSTFSKSVQKHEKQQYPLNTESV